MERYNIQDYTKFRSEFRRLLPGVPVEDLYDSFLSVAQGYLSIDPVALSRNLKRVFPYEWEHKSMEELITIHYGKEGMELINKVL